MAIIDAVIVLGNSLQLKGVLTEKAYDEVRGYHYNPPIPEQEYIALLKDID